MQVNVLRNRTPEELSLCGLIISIRAQSRQSGTWHSSPHSESYFTSWRCPTPSLIPSYSSVERSTSRNLAQSSLPNITESGAVKCFFDHFTSSMWKSCSVLQCCVTLDVSDYLLKKWMSQWLKTSSKWYMLVNTWSQWNLLPNARKMKNMFEEVNNRSLDQCRRSLLPISRREKKGS